MALKNSIQVLLAATGLLFVPLIASLFVEGWLWTGSDYVFAWIVFAIAGFAFVFVAGRGNNTTYKVATGIAVLTAFLLVWVTLAVGIIGDDNPGNTLYLGVLATGFLGSIIARCRPQGMAYTFFTAAIVQMIVPTIALIFWPADFSPGVVPVFGINAVLAMFWVGSGLLFLQAKKTGSSR